MKIHFVTALGLGLSPFQAYPCSTNLFIRVSIGASIMSLCPLPDLTVDNWYSVYLRFLLDIRKPRYFTFSESKCDIFVFSSLSVSFKVFFRKSIISSLMVLAKLSEPLIPTTQSSAYLF